MDRMSHREELLMARKNHEAMPPYEGKQSHLEVIDICLGMQGYKLEKRVKMHIELSQPSER